MVEVYVVNSNLGALITVDVGVALKLWMWEMGLEDVDVEDDLQDVDANRITFKKNETDRVRAKCADLCPWEILVSSIIDDRKILQRLVNAIRDLLSYVEHMHCVKHLHRTMKSARYTGQAVKDKLWSLSRAAYVGRLKCLMEEFKKMDEIAFNWLAKKEAHHWSRSHFSVASKCDMHLNNICEPFNAAILDAKDKPILTLLERI
ncbi:hypothetical protein Vadar_021916 [Vaccinium darrowii]|uniref:Uncharacterized protein n=1 Tax=Vaccinium darrowii TaxID=229202 RepID=A0ACB7YZI4_9ERIC|nr:hypothetical protein Vadar_021916 [Vaccinium darrowii]